MSQKADIPASAQQTGKFKRRQKWIRPDVQLKIVLRTLFVAILTLLINFQLSLIGYWLLFQEAGGGEGLQKVPTMLLKYFAISLGIAIPLSITVAVLNSFSFCGPIFRFSRFLHELVEGRWDRRCSIRSTDDLQDFNETINRAVDTLTSHIRDQHDVLQQTRAVLVAEGTRFEEPDTASGIVEKIDAELLEFDRRFAGAAPKSESEPSGEASESDAVKETESAAAT